MIIKIKVIANQPQTEIRETMADGTIKIAVKAPRDKGKANQALIRFLAKHYSVDKSQIKIKSGLTDAKKLIQIIDWQAPENKVK